MSKPTQPAKPTDDHVTPAELNAVAAGLAAVMAITSGAVVAAPEGGLQFADTDQGRALKSAVGPTQHGFLMGDQLIG